MKRSALVARRIQAFVLALILGAISGAATLWALSLEEVGPFQTTIDASSLSSVEDENWWMAGLIGAAFVFLVGALRSIVSRAKSRKVKHIALPSSSVEGRFELDAGEMMDAAAKSMEAVIGVQKVEGRIVRDRGQLVADFDVLVDAASELNEVGSACDQMVSELQAALQRDDVRSRCCLRVAPKKDRRRHLVH